MRRNYYVLLEFVITAHTRTWKCCCRHWKQIHILGGFLAYVFEFSPKCDWDRARVIACFVCAGTKIIDNSNHTRENISRLSLALPRLPFIRWNSVNRIFFKRHNAFVCIVWVHVIVIVAIFSFCSEFLFRLGARRSWRMRVCVSMRVLHRTD